MIKELFEELKDQYGNNISFFILFYVTYYVEHNIAEEHREEFFDLFKIADISKEDLLFFLAESDYDKRIEAIVKIFIEDSETIKQINIKEIQAQVKDILVKTGLEVGIAKEKERRKKKELAKRVTRNFRAIGAAKDLERKDLVVRYAQHVDLDQTLMSSFTDFNIMLTRKCTAGCRHCQLVWRLAGGRLTGKEREKQLERLIEIAEKDEKFKLIGLNGGEIFDHDSTAEEALFVVRNTRLPIGIQTNTSFATSLEAADRVVGAIYQAAKDKFGTTFKDREYSVVLQISMDSFHQEIISDKDDTLRQRIPIQNIVNVLQIVAEKYPEIGILLNCMLEPNYDEQLGELSLEVQKRGYLLAVGEEKAKKYEIVGKEGSPENHISIMQIALVNEDKIPINDHEFQLRRDFVNSIGWATLLREFEYIRNYAYMPNFISGPAFSFPIKGILVTGDGKIFADSAFIDMWTIGDINEKDLTEILRLAKVDPLLNFIEHNPRLLLALTLEVEPDFIERIKDEPNLASALFKMLESPSRRLYLTKRLIQVISSANTNDNSIFLGILGLPLHPGQLKAEYYSNIAEESGTGLTLEDMDIQQNNTSAESSGECL